MSKGGGSNTTVQKADPWSGQQPYLIGGGGTTTGGTWGPPPGAVTFDGIGIYYDAFGNNLGPAVMTGGTTTGEVPGIFPEAARLYQQGPLPYYPDATVANPFNADYNAGADVVRSAAGQAAAASSDMLQSLYGTNQQPIDYSIGLTGRNGDVFGVNNSGLRIDQSGSVYRPDFSGQPGTLEHSIFAPSGGQASTQYVAPTGRVYFDGMETAHVDPATGQVLSGFQSPVASAGSLDPYSILANNPNAAQIQAVNPLPSSTQNVNDILGMNYNNPALQASIDAATGDIEETFNEVTMPAISSAANMAGGYGGSRQGVAEGIAAGEMSEDVANVTAQMNADAYNQAYAAMYGLTGQLAGQESQYGLQNAQLAQQTNLANQQLAGQYGLTGAQLGMQGMSLAPELSAMGYNSGNMLMQLGGHQTQYDQALIDEAMARYYYPQESQWDLLNRYASIIQPGSGIGGTTTTESPEYSTDPLSQMLQVAMLTMI